MVQLKKERERRRRLRQITLSASQPPSQAELAGMLGCSQATVSRDLKRLASSRWSPFRRPSRGREDVDEEAERIASMPEGEFLDLVAKSVTLAMMSRRALKPLGRPFSRDYRPRLGRWCWHRFRCGKCGSMDSVRISGEWRRGETRSFSCPVCGGTVSVTRPR